jgi:hypothetical protein
MAYNDAREQGHVGLNSFRHVTIIASRGHAVVTWDLASLQAADSIRRLSSSCTILINFAVAFLPVSYRFHDVKEMLKGTLIPVWSRGGGFWSRGYGHVERIIRGGSKGCQKYSNSLTLASRP